MHTYTPTHMHTHMRTYTHILCMCKYCIYVYILICLLNSDVIHTAIKAVVQGRPKSKSINDKIKRLGFLSFYLVGYHRPKTINSP